MGHRGTQRIAAERRALRRRALTKDLNYFAEKAGWDVVEMTEYQLRIEGRVDYYPTSGKVFDLRSKKWHQTRNVRDLETFVNDPNYL